MSGLNKSIFCLSCGAIIPLANLDAHVTANPTHALIPYHHNIPLGGGDPIGAIISGSLRGSKRLHVDGSRTDTGTPETGTPAQPFRTIQAAIDYGVATFSAPFTVSIEQALYVEAVVLPDYATIDCPLGAVLRAPAGGNDALTVTGTTGDPEPAVGATVVRGLRLASDGDDGAGGTADSWAIRVVGDASGPEPREPLVIPHACSVDAFNEGHYLFSEGGAFFLSGTGGMGGDDTGGIGLRLKPLSGLSAQCLSNNAMLSFGSIGLDMYENSMFIGNGTRFLTPDGHSSPTKTVINMDASAGFSLVHIYQPSTMFGDPDYLIKAIGSGAGGPPSALITLHGGYNDLFDGLKSDAVEISDGAMFRIVDGSIRSDGGRGIVVDDASVWLRNATIISGDGYALEVHGNDSNVNSDDTIYEGNSGGPVSPTPGPVVLVDVENPSVSFTGGRMSGDGIVLDIVRGAAWMLGGVDLDPQNSLSTAYHVAAGAQIIRGHCNVRRGLRVVDGVPASETLLPSGFGWLDLGFYNCMVRIGSTLTAPTGGQGWDTGSLWVWPGHGVYQNFGTEAVPDWIPMGSGAALTLERLQMSASPRINLNSVTEAAPVVIPFGFSVNDNPPFNFLGTGIFEVTDAGLYNLSYNLPFETDGVILLQGCSAGACYQWSNDSGSSWNDILLTKSWDTVHGIEHDEGTMNLPPVEVELEAGMWLRVVAWQDPFVCNAYVNRVDGIDRAWARIQRGHIVYDYVPGNPADWDAPPPTTEGDALDRLAAKLAIPSFISGAGDPRVVPVIGYAGQIYKDTTSGIYYVCEADGTSLWGVL